MYIIKKHAAHELTTLQNQGIKIKITNGKAYDIKPSATYEIIQKPAAILCQLANTCKIIKTIPNYTQALEYLKKLK